MGGFNVGGKTGDVGLRRLDGLGLAWDGAAGEEPQKSPTATHMVN